MVKEDKTTSDQALMENKQSNFHIKSHQGLVIVLLKTYYGMRRDFHRENFISNQWIVNYSIIIISGQRRKFKNLCYKTAKVILNEDISTYQGYNKLTRKYIDYYIEL